MANAPLTYTIDEAAALIGIGRNAAYDAAHRGDIPTIRIGKRMLVLAGPLNTMLGAKPIAVISPRGDE